MIWIMVFGIWVLGMMAFYVLDGWFDYFSDAPDLRDPPIIPFFIAAAWPIWLVPVLIIYGLSFLHNIVKEKRKKFDLHKARFEKIRIAQEQELEKIQEEVDQELSAEFKIGKR